MSLCPSSFTGNLRLTRHSLVIMASSLSMSVCYHAKSADEQEEPRGHPYGAGCAVRGMLVGRGGKCVTFLFYVWIF